MEKEPTKQSKKFLAVFTACTLFLLALIGISIYLIDPFFQYRTKDNSYLLNPIYINPGLTKNYDYNTVIIGSSMVQNYDLSLLKQIIPNVKPVKLGSGAMTITEIKELYAHLNIDSVQTFIINIDIIQFNEWLQKSKYPSYLFSENILDKLRYHYAYESVVRYAFADVILGGYLHLVGKEDIPEKLKYRTSIHDIGNFKLDAVYNDPELVKQFYKDRSNLTYPNMAEIKERIENTITELIEDLEINKHPDKQYIFVLPPYSVLYWIITQIDEYYEPMMNGVETLCKVTEKYPNVQIQCFYTIPDVTNMNAYSDVTHFSPDISNFILNNLYNDTYTIDIRNMDNKINQLDSIIIHFKEQNKDWL